METISNLWFLWFVVMVGGFACSLYNRSQVKRDQRTSSHFDPARYLADYDKVWFPAAIGAGGLIMLGIASF